MTPLQLNWKFRQMKAIIVDDEPRAIELIKNYLTHFKAIDLLKTFRNPLQAFEYLNSNRVDLIFLDINMPHLSGLSLSKMIPPSVKIIFTTAYSEYAVESYEVDAADYLLKPISLERFTRAISKVLNAGPESAADDKNLIQIKSGSKIFQVNPDEILYLQKEGNYMMYYLADQKILARESVSQALQKLPDGFKQVHKSFIVHLKKIDYFDRNDISIGGALIPIGNRFKSGFIDPSR